MLPVAVTTEPDQHLCTATKGVWVGGCTHSLDCSHQAAGHSIWRGIRCKSVTAQLVEYFKIYTQKWKEFRWSREECLLRDWEHEAGSMPP